MYISYFGMMLQVTVTMSRYEYVLFEMIKISEKRRTSSRWVGSLEGSGP